MFGYRAMNGREMAFSPGAYVCRSPDRTACPTPSMRKSNAMATRKEALEQGLWVRRVDGSEPAEAGLE